MQSGARHSLRTRLSCLVLFVHAILGRGVRFFIPLSALARREGPGSTLPLHSISVSLFASELTNEIPP